MAEQWIEYPTDCEMEFEEWLQQINRQLRENKDNHIPDAEGEIPYAYLGMKHAGKRCAMLTKEKARSALNNKRSESPQ